MNNYEKALKEISKTVKVGTSFVGPNKTTRYILKRFKDPETNETLIVTKYWNRGWNYNVEDLFGVCDWIYLHTQRQNNQ